MLIVWWPVSKAESAMMMDDEKLTGALGPEGALGTMDCRLLLEDIVESWNRGIADVVGVDGPEGCIDY